MAFTPANIASGWLATGIFPRDRSKPLNSRLARQRDQDLGERPRTPEMRPQEVDSLAAISPIVFQTPKSSRQLVDITRDMRGLEPAYDRPIFRFLTRKLCKALDDKSAQIATLTHERDQLAAALELQKPQKRRKVKPSAQDRFVALLDVRRVKREVGLLEDKGSTDKDTESWVDLRDSDEEEVSEVEDCIVIS